MSDLLLRLAGVQWNGIPVASLVVFAIGGLMYVAMSRTPSASPARELANRRPGWIARRRARAGIKHQRNRIGVGYTSATRSVHLSARELAGHGFVSGGPGSGKTTFLQLLVEASANRTPVVVLDPKGSPALDETVRAHGGQVWTLDGRLPADLLDPRPWQVPDLLLEAEDYSADARAYRDAAHQRALWAAWALALAGRPMDVSELRRLMDRGELLKALEHYRGDRRVAEWLTRLTHQHGGIEDSGARGLDRALGTLLDGVALRGSLRACPEALRLDDVIETNGLVLFKLDAAEYPHATRKVASWILLGMGRVARGLGDVPLSKSAAQHVNGTNAPRALVLVDEVGALGASARHLRGLVGRARESGLAVVLATQGASDLEAVDRALLDQVLQDTAWQLVFRQGAPRDAAHMQALFGQAWTDDVTRYSDGRSSYRSVERPRVAIDEWLNGLHPGDAWLRVAPVDRGWRQQRVRVALPRPREMVSGTALGKYDGNHVSHGWRVVPEGVDDASAPPPNRDMPAQGALPAVPPDCPAALLERMGADILAKVERHWPRKHHELGPCLVWTGARQQAAAGKVYGKHYDSATKKSDLAHRIVWRRVYGAIPRGLDVDHKCDVGLCERPDHLQLLSKADNTRRRGSTRSKTPRADS